MKADAEMRRTPRAISRSATRSSSSGSAGGLGYEQVAAGAEEAQHARFGHGDDHACRGDAVGHLAGDIGETDAMRFVEAPVAQPLGVGGRQRGDEGVVAGAQVPRGGNLAFQGQAQARSRLSRVVDDVQGLPDPVHGIRHALGIEPRAGRAATESSDGGESHGVKVAEGHANGSYTSV